MTRCKEAFLAGSPPPIRAVLFDFGHTLIDFRRTPEALLSAYGEIRSRVEAVAAHTLPGAQELGVTVTAAVDELVRQSYEQGRLAELDVVELMVDAFAGIGVPLEPELARELAILDHRAFSESIQVPPAALRALETLAGQGLALGLVSNITLLPELLHADLAAYGLAPLLPAVAFSSEVGWRKPDPRAFRYALDQLGVEPAAAVFVGDRLYDDILGAGALGMRTVLARYFRDELAGPERAEALRIGAEALDAIQPDATLAGIQELPAIIDGWSQSS